VSTPAIGRSVFMVAAPRGSPSLRRNYERILAWCVVSGAFAVAGGLVTGATLSGPGSRERRPRRRSSPRSRPRTARPSGA